MPTYSYACTTCEHRFDTVQAFTDASLTECPECAGRLRKLFSSIGVVFKGSGFYRNDSRSNGAKPESSSDNGSGSNGSGESSSERKSDTKSSPTKDKTNSSSSSTSSSSASAAAS